MMYYKVTETETINVLQNIAVGNLKFFERIFKGNIQRISGYVSWYVYFLYTFVFFVLISFY